MFIVHEQCCSHHAHHLMVHETRALSYLLPSWLLLVIGWARYIIFFLTMIQINCRCLLLLSSVKLSVVCMILVPLLERDHFEGGDIFRVRTIRVIYRYYHAWAKVVGGILVLFFQIKLKNSDFQILCFFIQILLVFILHG